MGSGQLILGRYMLVVVSQDSMITGLFILRGMPREPQIWDATQARSRLWGWVASGPCAPGLGHVSG